MDSATLSDIEQRFTRFCEEMKGGPETRPLFDLKHDHTLRVRDMCVRIAEALDWPEGEVNLAAAVGLLHDVGRFPQIRDYGHIRDHDSFNHARRSMEIVQGEAWLEDCEPDEQQAILDAIDQHNRLVVDETLPALSLRLARLIRDADKLDILMRVFDDLREQAGADDRTPSPALVAEVLAGRAISYRDVKTFPDMLVAWLAWPYDLNYAPSRAILRESNALDKMFAFLAPVPELQQVRRNLDQLLAS